MAADFFGLPYDLVAFIVVLIFFAAIFITRRVVSGVPVEVNWVYPGTRTALRFVGGMDLNGVFLEVRKAAKGKKLATIQREGLPLEIQVIPSKDMKRGYLFEREVEVKAANGQVTKETRHFYGLDVAAGGRKRITSFISVEGSGRTIDVLPDGRASSDPTANPTTSLINEEVSTLQKIFALLGAAMQGSIRGIIVPMLAGVGLGGTAIMMVILLTGHFH